MTAWRVQVVIFLSLLWQLLLPCELGTQWDMKINPALYLKRATQRHKHATSQWGRIFTVATWAACYRWERKLENFQGNQGRTNSNWVDWTGFGVRPVLQAWIFDQLVIISTALASSDHISTALCKVSVVFFRCSLWHHLTNLPFISWLLVFFSLHSWHSVVFLSLMLLRTPPSLLMIA